MTSAELIAALRRRDETALKTLYDRFGTLVYASILRITRDPQTAEEITLDAFLHVWEHAADMKEQARVEAWLLTVARSRAIDRLRSASAAKRNPAAPEPAPLSPPGPDELAEQSQHRKLVQQAMEQLNASQRAALTLAYYEGLSHSQIAERLQEPLGTVKTRIRQAMEILRDTLQPVLTSS